MTATMTWSNDKDGLALSLVTLNSLITNHLWHQDLWEPDRQDMTVETVKSVRLTDRRQKARKSE